MTNEEAIKELEQIPKHIGGDCDGYEKRAIRIAIEALEKQIPKKVVKYKRVGDALIGGYCPVCNAELHINNRPCYCGQVLNWE